MSIRNLSTRIIIMTFKKKRNLFIGFAGCIQEGTAERAKACPPDRMLLETDSPWLAPPWATDNPWVIQLSDPGQIASTAAIMAKYIRLTLRRRALE